MELLELGEVRRATALPESMKAKWQVTLNSGNWKVAWPLAGEPDPLTRRPFAGTEAELEVAAGWVQALDELQKKTNVSLTAKVARDDESDDDAKDGDSKRKGRRSRAPAAAAKAAAAKGSGQQS